MTDQIFTPPMHAMEALVKPEADETYVPSLFQLNGRIGRVRYLAYGVVCNLLVFVAAVALTFTVGGSEAGDRVAEGIPALAGLVLAIVMGGRRLHDLGRTRWFALGLLVPVVNIVVALWLICAPGQAQANRFGPRPGRNTRGLILLAWVVPLVALAGILAALLQGPHKTRFERARDEMEQAI